MINDELIKIWKSSAKIEQVKFDKSRLMIEIQSNIDQFNKRIKLRDLMEISAAIVVILIFVYILFFIPYLIPHLVSKIASGLIVVWAIYVIYRFLTVRKIKPSEYSENYLSYLIKNRVYFMEQKKLLDSIFWWYLAPFLFCLLLFVSGYIGESTNNASIIITITGGVIVSVLTYFLNKNASKKEFDPKIKKIENLIKMLKETKH